MNDRRSVHRDGFTLVELLVALLVLSLLALTAYRGLQAVLDARARVDSESQKWRRVGTFFARFEHDVQLAVPRPIRTAAGDAPAWLGRAEAAREPLLEFTRAGTMDGSVAPRRTGYRLNQKQQVELWLWPGIDLAPGATPATHVVLEGVVALSLEYMNADATWLDRWPGSRLDPPVPRAVRMRLVLASNEELVRVFALKL